MVKDEDLIYWYIKNVFWIGYGYWIYEFIEIMVLVIILEYN